VGEGRLPGGHGWGIAFKIDPRDPIPGLFDLAVNNAEKAAKQKASPGEIE
jgi:hypothetical protein